MSESNAPVRVVDLDGPIDAKNVAALESSLRSEPSRTVVLDLERVRYINSAGMAYLIQLSDTLEAAGGGLHLANAQPKVKVVLDLMGLTAFLPLHASVRGALRAARS